MLLTAGFVPVAQEFSRASRSGCFGSDANPVAPEWPRTAIARGYAERRATPSARAGDDAACARTAAAVAATTAPAAVNLARGLAPVVRIAPPSVLARPQSAAHVVGPIVG